jgi:RNA-directed DNA polymerase
VAILSGGGNMCTVFIHKYNNIISVENLCKAWKEFLQGKANKKDVADFALNLSKNIFDLHIDLGNKTYIHSEYHAFNISDPKPRNIHKASVRDRLLHHAIYRILYLYFDKKFIYDSYSCRKDKGTHKAIERFKHFGNKVSKNNTRTCFVLKCDIRKFFASIDHAILKNILSKHIEDKNVLWLVSRIIDSFNTENKTNVGLPLGNLTSQLLVNIYMNEFDNWMKHIMKVKYYERYADDFVIFSTEKDYLLELTPKISDYLKENLKLDLHPKKVFLKTLASGVDFLGWVNFPKWRVLRTSTKRRMFNNLRMLDVRNMDSVKESYLGMLKWGNGRKLVEKIYKT